MKRNDIVCCSSGATKDPPHFSPYGRIVRKVNQKFEVIFCNGESWLLDENDLEVHYYRGRFEYRGLNAQYSIIVPFPTLRKLKVLAKRYQQTYGQRNMFNEIC